MPESVGERFVKKLGREVSVAECQLEEIHEYFGINTFDGIKDWVQMLLGYKCDLEVQINTNQLKANKIVDSLRELKENLKSKDARDLINSIILSLEYTHVKRNENYRPIICVLSSTRFIEDIKAWALQKTKESNLVFFTPVCKEEIPELESFRDELEIQQFQKIQIADKIFVFNKEGYIGDHTRKEIQYAESLYKPINYLVQE